MGGRPIFLAISLIPLSVVLFSHYPQLTPLPAHTIQTALHLATHLQQTEMIRKLLIAGASLNITDHKGNTPLHVAARFSSTKSLEEIIRYMSVQTILQVAAIKNNQGQTCIHIAAKQGNMDVLRKFKSLGVNMDMQVRTEKKTRGCVFVKFTVHQFVFSCGKEFIWQTPLPCITA